MVLGIQLAMLCDGPIDAAISRFSKLQRDFSLSACEIHLEASLYKAAIWPWEQSSTDNLHALRKDVSTLGVHMPFMDLNLLSENRIIREASRKSLFDSVELAGRIGADYVVMHVRVPSEYSRPLDLDEVREELTKILGQCEKSGCLLLVENADDLRAPVEVASLVAQVSETAGICLDIGHLFEREYPESRLRHRMLRINDIFSPKPFLMKEGLPVSDYDGWSDVARSLAGSIGCVHVHNHDGRIAHKPILSGRVDLAPLASLSLEMPDIPLIVEADYRDLSPDAVHADLSYLAGLMGIR